MLDSNSIANFLNEELKTYGSSELVFSKNLFSGQLSEKAGIAGKMHGVSYKVSMFEASIDAGFPAVSAHFSCNISDLYLSDERVEMLSSDNRFIKIYQQDEEHMFMTCDTFFPRSYEKEFLQSIVKIWAGGMQKISRL